MKKKKLESNSDDEVVDKFFNLIRDAMAEQGNYGKIMSLKFKIRDNMEELLNKILTSDDDINEDSEIVKEVVEDFTEFNDILKEHLNDLN